MTDRLLGLLSAGLAFLGLAGLGTPGCKKARSPEPLTRPPQPPSSTTRPAEPPPAPQAPRPADTQDLSDVRFIVGGPDLAEASARGELVFVPPPAVTVRTLFEIHQRPKGPTQRSWTTCYIIRAPSTPALLAPTQVALQLTLLERFREQGALSAEVFVRILRGLAAAIDALSDADCRACGLTRADLEQRLLGLGAPDFRAAGR